MLRNRSILSESVAVQLDRVGEGMARGRPTAEVVKMALHALDPLPPHIIERARHEIVERCGLHARSRRLCPSLDLAAKFVPALARPSREDQLRDVPGLEHLFLFHWDGFLREAALNRLHEGARSPFFFGAIVYRLNDWVWQVRAAAARCAARVFPATEPGVVAAAAVSLLGQTDSWSRWGDEAALLDDALCRPDVAEALATWLRTARTGPMPRVLTYALRRPAMDRYLPSLARESAMPAVRAKALGSLIDARAAWPVGFGTKWIDKSHGLSRRVRIFHERPLDRVIALEELVALGAADGAAPARRVAIEALVRHHASLANADRLVALFLRDKSPSIRERAEFVAKARASD
ncbi:MAG TPA: hypothetical protein VF548_02945 [Allosphingosinicella sp.]|jgi:hypothetical protein